jgi:hypothetical protein
MKRFWVVFFFVLGLALMAAPRAIYAQTPSTTVRVLNNTNDGSLIGVEVGGVHTTTLIPYGAYFEVPFYDNTWGFLGNTAVSYTITACPANHVVSQSAASDIPEWATSTTTFSSAAITSDYLRRNPSQRDLEEHVRAIVNILNARDELGRKETKIKPLESWLKRVKKMGLTQVRQACDSSSEWTGVLPGTLDVTSYYGWRVIIIEITDSHPTYHSAVMRGN